MKPLVYVAGPYTNPDPVLNVRRACAVADMLVDAGAAVVVPHLSMLWHLTSPAELEAWYARDIDVMEHCGAVVRFSGASTGADRECDHAIQRGMPLWLLSDDGYLPLPLRAWIRGSRCGRCGIAGGTHTRWCRHYGHV